MIRKIALATYAINFSQVANMVLTALVVPLVIGAEQYGKYAAIFALPAFLQSTIEAFAVLNLSKERGGAALWRAYSLLAGMASLTSMVVYFVLFDGQIAAWALVLGVALMSRSAAAAIVYTHSSMSYVWVTVGAEIVTALVYASVLGVAVLIGRFDFTLPLVMIIAASICATTYIAIEIQKAGAMTSQYPEGGNLLTWDSARFLWSRSYEDLTLTLMPLFIAKSFGLATAGEFRFIVSCMKVVGKLFPYRYEVILRAIKTNDFHVGTFLRLSLAFVVVGVAMAVGLFLVRGHVFLSADTPVWTVALATGMLVTSLAGFPAATGYSNAPVLASTAGAALSFGSILAGNLPAFLMLFLLTSTSTYVAVLYTLWSGPFGVDRSELGN